MWRQAIFPQEFKNGTVGSSPLDAAVAFCAGVLGPAVTSQDLALLPRGPLPSVLLRDEELLDDHQAPVRGGRGDSSFRVRVITCVNLLEHVISALDTRLRSRAFQLSKTLDRTCAWLSVRVGGAHGQQRRSARSVGRLSLVASLLGCRQY
ncbi:hypothetical protein NDU88_000625 [Pleurodeles waltl]|uniref:Uncharacterized protein n=1 Tax=Pleurodeles waltl TaxID=8319 RepID=A0AAV7WK16_PLEWA|nr:hypothetical protein NDU88_000625 [Pleurodeles waltl]